MQKNPLIAISTGIACVIVLASFTNVVAIRVESMNHIAKDETNAKELLFQTIFDMATNRDIQKIIYISEFTEKRFFDPAMKLSVFNPPILTQKLLKYVYTIGVILTKTISKSKISLILGEYQVSNQKGQEEISDISAKDATLRTEMMQLSSLSCDCEKNSTTIWHFPVLCLILLPIALFVGMLWYIIGIILHLPIPNWLQNLFDIIRNIATTLNCWT